MMTRRILSLGALVVLAACSGARGSSSSPRASNAGLPWVTARAQGGDVVERAVAQKATGAQAGTVKDVNDRYIVIDPYESWAGDARIALAANTPVFKGDNRVRESVKDAVRPGQEVNVYFDQQNGAPRAMGIKLLSADEARQLRTAISQRSRPAGGAGTGSSGSSSGVLGSKDEGSGGGILSPKDDRSPSSGGVLSSKDGGSTAGNERAGPARFGTAASQSGRISSLSGNELVLDPYQASAADARLRIGPDVQVMRGGERVGREALRSGEDVRVFFEEGNKSGGVLRGRVSGANDREPRVIGIEILSDDQAARLRRAEGR